MDRPNLHGYTVAERVAKYTDRRGPNDCWNWTSSVSTRGYGSLSIKSIQHYAHRLAYEFAVGPIPDDLTIDHLCFNKLCVNPAHLEAVTREENTRRAHPLGPNSKPRNRKPRKKAA